MNQQRFSATARLEPGTVLVEAAAGTGKTYGITNLVLRLVAEKGFTIDRILVVTFTDAATSELRDRIRKRLVQARDRVSRIPEVDESSRWTRKSDRKLVVEDEVLRLLTSADYQPVDERQWVPASKQHLDTVLTRLSAAVRALDAAPISTIHGFCSEVLRTRAFESGAQLESELVEDTLPLLEEIVDDHLSGELHGVDDARCAFLVDSCGMKREPLLKLARKALAWPQARVEPANPAQVEAAWQAAASELLERWRGEEGREARAAIDQACASKVFEGKTYTPAKTQSCGGELEEFLASPTPEKLLADVDKAWVRYFSSSQLGAKSGNGFAHPLFEAWDALVEQANDVIAAPAAAFALRVRDEFRASLASSGQLTFDGMLRQVRDAIVREDGNGPLTEALRARYDAALIDEFQDTDDVQWPTFERVFRRSPRHYLFLIGDPKQAIYRFRGADIQVYSDAKRTVGPFCTMLDNYRSDPGCVRAMNALFGNPPDPFREKAFAYGEVNHKKPARLQFPIPRAPFQVRWLDRQTRPDGTIALPDSESVSAPITKGIAHRRLVPLVVHEVESLLGSGATIRREGRDEPVSAGDIAVLVRANRQAKKLHSALRAASIPAIVSDAGSVFDSNEAWLIECWLAALAAPSREAPTRLLALTPMIGWTARQLDQAVRRAEESERATDQVPVATAVAAVEDSEGALADPDEQEPSAQDSASEHDWRRLRNSVARWATTLERIGFYRTFRRALDRCATLERLAAFPDGERRLTDLRHMMELLHEVSVRERLDASGLLRWLRSQRRTTELDQERTLIRLESDANAARVVTLHKSKGLQYPIVLLPYVWDGQLLQNDEKKFLLYHDGNEVGIDVRSSGPAKRLHEAAAREEAWRENMRILYVGLTRAEHHLVAWWGPVKGADDSAFGAVLHGRAREGSSSEDRHELAQGRLAPCFSKDAPDFRPMLDDLQDAAASRWGEQPLIACSRLPAPAASQSVSRRAGEQELPVRSFAGELDLDWRRMSYTSLSKALHVQAVHVGPEPQLSAVAQEDDAGKYFDRDNAAELQRDDTGDIVPTPEQREVGLADMRSGTEIGKWVHKIFEDLDFTTMREKDGARRELDTLVPALGRRMGVTDKKQHDLVIAHLPAILSTPLGGPLGSLALKDIPAANRLDELSFDMPVENADGTAVSGEALAERIAADTALPAEFRERLSLLDDQRLVGLLTGSIDLAFRAGPGDRWFLADYKTNRLATPPTQEKHRGVSTPECYRREQLQAQMDWNAYFLQLHLYLVALHRYLRFRLRESYSYDKHVGGAYYLFVRGMEGPQTCAAGERGVFFHRPEASVIEGISNALDPKPWLSGRFA